MPTAQATEVSVAPLCWVGSARLVKCECNTFNSWKLAGDCYLAHVRLMWSCRSFWDSGTATMAVAALIMATGALSVAIINGRVPVFEIVVTCIPFHRLLTACTGKGSEV